MSGWFTKASDAGCGHKFRVRLAGISSLPFLHRRILRVRREYIHSQKVDSVRNLNFKVIDLGSLPQDQGIVRFI